MGFLFFLSQQLEGPYKSKKTKMLWGQNGSNDPLFSAQYGFSFQEQDTKPPEHWSCGEVCQSKRRSHRWWTPWTDWNGINCDYSHHQFKTTIAYRDHHHAPTWWSEAWIQRGCLENVWLILRLSRKCWILKNGFYFKAGRFCCLASQDVGHQVFPQELAHTPPTASFCIWILFFDEQLTVKTGYA